MVMMLKRVESHDIRSVEDAMIEESLSLRLSRITERQQFLAP
jgi:hypothetical protein